MNKKIEKFKTSHGQELFVFSTIGFDHTFIKVNL